MGVQLAEKSNVGWAAVKGEGAVCKPLVGGSFKNKPNMGGGETFRVPSPLLENFQPGPKSCQT